MGLFGKKNGGKRCPECVNYVMLEGHGYCAKDVPPTINVRMLSKDGIKRQCPPCPAAMTCSSWMAK